MFSCVELEFGFNVSQHVVEIEVLPDDDRTEMREAFTIHLTMDEFMIADIQVRNITRDKFCKIHLIYLEYLASLHLKNNLDAVKL